MYKTILLLLALFYVCESKGQSITYQYDNLQRLVEVIFTDGRIIKYSYDPSGNIKTRRTLQANVFTGCTNNISLYAGSSVNSKNYQWRVDTSSGFHNIQ